MSELETLNKKRDIQIMDLFRTFVAMDYCHSQQPLFTTITRGLEERLDAQIIETAKTIQAIKQVSV
jgi:hypothetical protein